jgi:hypothetical protein
MMKIELGKELKLSDIVSGCMATSESCKLSL